MKKNISINLQGIIFHIEVLSRYLSEVKAHFASYQGHEEIVADIEGRIAELFSARLSASKQVITLADVEEMTAKMGRVSDFAPEPDEEEAAEAAGATGSTFGPNGPFGPKGPFGPEGPFGKEGPFGPKGPFAGRQTDADGQPRRLYRDLAHRKVAGVCAGLAVIAYVVLWIALPKRDDAPTPIDTLDFGGALRGRKLFRDVDTGKVGGVAAGLAAYFRSDVVLVRVLFLLSAFLTFGSTIIVYIVLWVVVPEALSVSEKMQMRGDAVTLSGIDNNLRSNAFDTENTTPAGTRSVGTFLEGAARGARPAATFLGSIIRWVVGLLLVFIGGSWLFSVFIMLGAALSIIPFTAVERTSNGFMFDESFGALVRNLPLWGALAGALLLGVPSLRLLLLGLRLLLRRPVLGRSAGGVLLGLWLLGVVGSTAAWLQVARNFQTKGTYTTTVRLEAVPGRGIVLDSRDVESHFERVNLHVAPADSGKAPYVEEEFRASGRTEDAARLTAQQTMVYHIDQRDSTITFDEGFRLKDNAPARSQRLSLTLYLPLDKVYRLTPIFIDRLDDDDFTTGHSPDTDGDRSYHFRLTREGKFTCLDCPASSDADDEGVVNVDVAGAKTQVRVNTDGDEPTVHVSTSSPNFNTDPGHYGSGRKAISSGSEFSEIEASGLFRVLVRQGNSFKAEAAGRTSDLEDVRLEVHGDRLVIRSRRTGGLFSAFGANHSPILVQ
ncbi:MAG: PspC domain-containing protein, partial [Cytophagaceae bacterium]